MSTSEVARLAFWAKGMTGIQDARMEWPGFSYSEEEWSRLRELSAAVSIGVYQKFVAVNAVIFIAIAAIGIGAVFIPLATLLFPVPAETSALKFSVLLASCAFLTIGLGLPVSMRAATALTQTQAMRQALSAKAEDERLAAKVSWQINRMMLIMCGLLVPGMLLFITYDIDAGPMITTLKWVAIAVMAAASLVGVARRKGR